MCTRPILAALLTLVVVPGIARAQPKQGNLEIRLSVVDPIMPAPPNASGTFVFVPPEEDYYTVVNFGAGVGYLLSEHWELGAQAAVNHVSWAWGDASVVEFAPFLRFVYVPERIGFFFEVSSGVHCRVEDESDAAFSLGLATGVETFITERWSFRLGPAYTLMRDEGESTHLIGVAWGIGVYL